MLFEIGVLGLFVGVSAVWDIDLDAEVFQQSSFYIVALDNLTLDWNESSTCCKLHGTYLATIHDEDENADLIRNNTYECFFG